MTGAELLGAAALDALLGDPRGFPHPVRAMGAVVSWIDARVRNWCPTESALQTAGIALAVGLPAAAFVSARFIISGATSLSPWFGTLVEIGLAYTTLAGRDLVDHVQAVGRALGEGDLEKAREAVAMIVGRDSAALTEPEVVRATVETIAESASDGIMAPLVYLTLGGAPLALAYKAVNTLDSMIGHRDARYAQFGWASARLDDVLNWVPARLTGLCIALAAGLTSGRLHPAHMSWYILHRDGDQHPSPNSGVPEAAMAGALGVQLGGRNYYQGEPQDRPLIGDDQVPLAPAHITQATRLMITASILGLTFALVSLWLA